MLGQLLAPQTDCLEQQDGRVERVPALPRLARGVRGPAAERDVHVLAGEQDGMDHVAVGRVEEQRRVQAIEEPVVEHELLAAAPLLGRCSEEDDLPGERVAHRREGDRGADAGCGHRVVAAAMAQARQRVVLREDADPRPIGSEAAGQPAAYGGGEAAGRVLHEEAVGGDRRRDPRRRAMLLEGGLRVGMDRPRERQDLVAVGLDGGRGAGLQVGRSGHADLQDGKRGATLSARSTA